MDADIKAKFLEVLSGERSVSLNGHTVQSHSLPELIQALQYLDSLDDEDSQKMTATQFVYKVE